MSVSLSHEGFRIEYTIYTYNWECLVQVYIKSFVQKCECITGMNEILAEQEY